MKTLKALASALVLLALVIGLPIALWKLGGNPIPQSLPTWDGIVAALTRRDDGTLFMGFLTVVGWVAWASFATAVLLELPAQLRGLPAVRLRALSPQQRVAAVLVSAVLAGLGAASATPATALPTPAAATQVADAPTQTAPPSPNDGTEQRGDTHESGSRRTDDQPVYRVQAGDSLWSIAQVHLGDGSRWTEIRDLNLGRPQPDGHQLQLNAEWIEPGWELLLPVDARTPTSADDQVHTVEPGETLSEIAERWLGDADRYPEIVGASRHIVQPDGEHLTDPDLIRPGWHLVIPADAPHAAVDTRPSGDQTTEQPSSTTVGDAAAASFADPLIMVDSDHEEPADPRPAETSDPVDIQVDVDVTVRDDGHTVEVSVGEHEERVNVTVDVDVDDLTNPADDLEATVPVRTLGGIGTMLSVGVLGLVLARRRRAQRERPPGHQLVLPSPGSAESSLEHGLHVVADPLGLDTVNRAFRHLGSSCGPLPVVRFARLSNDGAGVWLHLNEPASLPAPWAGDEQRLVWHLDADDVPNHLAKVVDAPAPWPGMVTLGHDEDDAHVIVDLEHIGHLDVRGDRTVTAAALSALAAELAASIWADDLQVTIVGGMPVRDDVFGTGRIRRVETVAQALAELTKRVKRSERIETSRLEDPQAWTPEIVVVGPDAVAREMDEVRALTALVPSPGVAVLTASAGEAPWVLDLEPGQPPAGVLEPVKLRVRPQQLNETDYQAIVKLLEEATTSTPGPEWAARLAEVHEPSLRELGTAPVADPPAEENQTEGLSQDALDVSDGAGPMVRVLGEVTLTGITTQPLSRPSEEARALELVAYLALHPYADTDSLTEAMWPASTFTHKEKIRNTRNTAVSRARRWLGRNDTGDYYLPITSTRDSNAYRLDGIGTDWDVFQQLIGRDLTTTPLARLRQALGLVRGEPFSRATRPGRRRVGPEHYAWAEPLKQYMVTSVMDVACEAARRYLLDADPISAGEAAAAALRVDPSDERAWRYALRAAHQVGDSRGVDILVNDLHKQLIQVDAEPEDATMELIDAILTARESETA